MQIMNEAEMRLNRVSRIYVVLGWIGVLLSLLLLVAAWFAIVRRDEPEDVRILLVAVYVGGELLSALFFAALIAVGGIIHRRSHHAVCVVVSQILCLAFPIGTVVGLYALYVLRDPPVKSLFH